MYDHKHARYNVLHTNHIEMCRKDMNMNDNKVLIKMFH